MTMNALATTNGNTLSIPSNETFEVLYRMARVGAAAAGLTKRSLKPDEAMYIILHGYALNIDPIVALNQIYIVNGKPTCSAQLMIALANKSGALSRLDIPDPGEVNDSATVIAVRKDRPDTEYRATFTMAMANKAGLATKDNWKKYPGQMLIARAVSACLRQAVPDAIAGMYTVEEINTDVTVDDAGNPSPETPQIISGSLVEQEPQHWAEDTANQKIVVEAIKAADLTRDFVLEHLEQPKELRGFVETRHSIERTLERIAEIGRVVAKRNGSEAPTAPADVAEADKTPEDAPAPPSAPENGNSDIDLKWLTDEIVADVRAMTDLSLIYETDAALRKDLEVLAQSDDITAKTKHKTIEQAISTLIAERDAEAEAKP